ncbi:HAMP domain-containing sensor histidine kinase [Aureibaculum sp. 2210JD6-5]|uniref:sensor histidine kinase n=1 Tax=Aureibaculum sp. 2210JD6-5 TaxID=3103957 RepID=UPI002AADD3B2|nr:HAMP domain-containing sensor histidine kinase [Aureibaculum sp. 2210JD6-5]MDY7396396.1 HAMP domain-containing sensor histidine kinase [Aureibaculum sp. 2210JD6-5]
MNLPFNKNIIRWILITAAFLLVALILWNTNTFFKNFKQEERTKMEILATALKNMNSLDLDDLDADISLEDQIIKSNKNIPMIFTTEDNVIKGWANLDVEDKNTQYNDLPDKDRMYLANQLAEMRKENNQLIVPRVSKDGPTTDYIYYRNSDLLYKLRYYPLALLLILCLFAIVIYLVFKSTKVAEQNKLWAGMAKETAHQIGTPLSSLLGWVEILRMDNTDENTVMEIEKDIERLNTIANRFSKIGSVPKLTRHNIVLETKKSFDYYSSRSSKLIDYHFDTDEDEKIYAMINQQLFSWVIENLVKNAIDAMEGKGTLRIKVFSKDGKFVQVQVTDTGKGIPKNLYRKIFEPGYTTKRRGWGLGLSLTKRIMEDYHDGKILVEKSEIGVGTTMSVLLKEL